MTPFPPAQGERYCPKGRSNGGFLRDPFRFNAEAHIFATQGVHLGPDQPDRLLIRDQLRLAVTNEHIALLALTLTKPICIRLKVLRVFISIVSGMIRVRSVR